MDEWQVLNTLMNHRLTGKKEMSAKKGLTPRSWLIPGDHLQLKCLSGQVL